MKERKPSKVWLAGSGEHGCLFDCVTAHRNQDHAINMLIERFDIGRTRRAGTLRRDHYLELDPYTDGAEYCEITEADVDEWWDAERGAFKDEY